MYGYPFQLVYTYGGYRNAPFFATREAAQKWWDENANLIFNAEIVEVEQ